MCFVIGKMLEFVHIVYKKNFFNLYTPVGFGFYKESFFDVIDIDIFKLCITTYLLLWGI